MDESLFKTSASFSAISAKMPAPGLGNGPYSCKAQRQSWSFAAKSSTHRATPRLLAFRLKWERKKKRAENIFVSSKSNELQCRIIKLSQ